MTAVRTDRQALCPGSLGALPASKHEPDKTADQDNDPGNLHPQVDGGGSFDPLGLIGHVGVVVVERASRCSRVVDEFHGVANSNVVAVARLDVGVRLLGDLVLYAGQLTV
jgi:hypothetical protein